jgi:hypothetical protein
MKRRSFLRAATAAVSGHFMLGAAKAQPIPGSRTFNLLLDDEGEHPARALLDAFEYNGNIYYLARESGEDAESLHKVGCTSSGGQFVWRRRLPLGAYRGIGMSENGDLLTVSISPLYKGNPVNSVYSVVPGDGNQVTWLSAVPSDGAPRSAAFVKGAHFGSVSSGGLSMTTLENARRGDAPTRSLLPVPAFRDFDVLEYGEGVLFVDKETAAVDAVRGPVSATYSRTSISGGAVSSARAALEPAKRGVPANGWVNLIAASGMVNNSLHLFLSPFVKAMATHAWCDPTFTVRGIRAIDLSPYLVPHGGLTRGILQLGTETAMVFRDGTVVAFPIPS